MQCVWVAKEARSAARVTGSCESNLTWLLGLELRSSGRVIHALNTLKCSLVYMTGF